MKRHIKRKLYLCMRKRTLKWVDTTSISTVEFKAMWMKALAFSEDFYASLKRNSA
jgi:hypothetical protein